jgi:hypothetical protein
MQPTKVLRAHLYAILILTSACARQAEGERCDINSGSPGDCETGLVCRTSDQPGLQGRGVALCCPINEGPSTVNACRAGAMLPEEPDDVVPPAPIVDAGAVPVPSVDAGVVDGGV